MSSEPDAALAKTVPAGIMARSITNTKKRDIILFDTLLIVFASFVCIFPNDYI